jgi:hypothetical protein
MKKLLLFLLIFSFISVKSQSLESYGKSGCFDKEGKWWPDGYRPEKSRYTDKKGMCHFLSEESQTVAKKRKKLSPRKKIRKPKN